MTAKWRMPVQADRLWPLWYLLAILTGALATGRWTLAPAAWLSGVFMIRFVRTQRPLRGFLLGVPAMALVFWVGWSGLIPWGGEAFAVMAIAVGVTGMLVYSIDRVLYPRLRGIPATLVYPCALVAFEFLLSFAGDAGSSFGLTAYSQHDVLPLVQMASVTGLWGITFLVAWFASVANYLWEHGFQPRRAAGPVGAFCAVLALALLAGGTRMVLAGVPGETVRVAMVAEPALSGPEEFWPSDAVERRYLGGEPLSDAEWDSIAEGTRRVHDRLFTRSAAEVAAGARMVFWAEGNAPVRAEDEPALLGRAAALAREHGVYLGMGMLMLPRDVRQKLQNKVVVVSPDGRVAAEYHKSVPVPGIEAALLRPGDGRLGIVDTPYGRLGLAICYDLDFPRLIRQAGRAGVDILVGPSNDWPAIARTHAEMAAFRAVEEGVSLVRPTTEGISIATDPYGRVLASMDASTNARSVAAQVEVRGVRTLYPRIGDAVAWASLAGLVLLAVAALRRKRSPADADTPSPALPPSSRVGTRESEHSIPRT
ncbi:MAG TPA: nitrilase-related carbon-nitrogen hydrolase [Longimicrobium sp.]|nr:nitrilase-related carbon-nitrogen hydrolase [Longimicrobium sp.]